MVPLYDFKVTNLEDVESISETYYLDFVNNRIINKVNDLEAMRQAIFKILNTERQSNIIYNADYGVEIERFIGKDIDFIKSDLERTISEALIYDDRVLKVTDFKINELQGDTMHISYTVNTIYGDLSFKSEVSI